MSTVVIVEYLVAVGVTLLALLARVALDPFLGDHQPYITFFIAVTVTTYYAKLGPSLTAVVLGGLASEWFFTPPRHSFQVAGVPEAVGSATYFILSLTIVVFGQGLRRAKQRAEDAVEGLRREAVERREAEAGLRESEARFRGIFNQAIAAMAELDLTGRFIQVNRRYVELVGRTTDELARLHMQDITHPDDLPSNRDLFLAMVEGQRDAYVVETRYVRPNGSVIWVSSSVSALMDSNGHARGAVAVSMDITERKHSEQALKRSEERYRDLYASMDEGFCVIEVLFDKHNKPVDYIFIEVNPSFERQTGMHQARGRRVREIVPEHEQQWFDLYGHIVLTGESRRFEYPARQSERWYEGYAYSLGEAWERKVAILFKDITERKKSEEQQRRFTLDLEARVAERTSALLASHEQLRALATELNLTEHRERKRLASELHDHLAQLLVLARLKLGLVRQTLGVSSPCAQLLNQMEEVLSASLTYTRTLVADLSPPVLHEFGLEAALRWLAERMEGNNLRVSLLLEQEEALELPEDQAVLLFQSVRELLMNVMKHAQAEQAVIKLQQDGPRLVIRVEDHGRGFDTTNLETGVSTSTAWSSKFGLFSIRERMNALGGSFEIVSMPGKGTTATLVLPVTRQSSLQGSNLEHDDSAPGSLVTTSQVTGFPRILKDSERVRIRVLLVDDHAMVRQGLRSLLEGYADLEVVGEATDGEEALEQMEQLKPSVIVMDVNMPKMNGIEATAKIKTRYPKTVVIGLSVNAAGENDDAMRTAGAAMLLTKEAAVEHLHGAIRQAVKSMEMNAHSTPASYRP